MSSTTEYTIQHVQLSAGFHPPVLSPRSYYFVFWYESIPLGDRYFQAYQILSEENFWSQCIMAITPSLLSYSGGESLKLRSTWPSIRRVCAAMLDRLQHAQPETVDVSVVICTRNRHLSLQRCLNALAMQQCRPLEIIVVDNASDTQDTFDVASRFDVRYIQEHRKGLDIARNRGVKEARASIVAFTDDDTIPDPNWVFRIHEAFLNPSMAGMTGLVIAASLSNEAEVIFEKYWPFNRGYVHRIFGESFFESKQGKCPPVWEIGAGANMAFRREVFQVVGMFDERLDVGAAGCSGDSEMWYRMLANGMEIHYQPKAVVHHIHRSSVYDLKRQLFSYMRGFTVAMLIQHQQFSRPGTLEHLFWVLPRYYMKLLRNGFPHYPSQYTTIFAEMKGMVSGLIYFIRHRHQASFHD